MSTIFISPSLGNSIIDQIKLVSEFDFIIVVTNHDVIRFNIAMNIPCIMELLKKRY